RCGATCRPDRRGDHPIARFVRDGWPEPDARFGARNSIAVQRPQPREHVMPFKVQVGPHQVSIHQGQTVLVTEPDGQINWPSEKGLYFLDTRVVSSWAIYANGEPWNLLNGGAVTHYASRIHLTNRKILTPDGIIPERTLGLVVSRLISGGMHEDLDITNNSMKRV